MAISDWLDELDEPSPAHWVYPECRSRMTELSLAWRPFRSDDMAYVVKSWVASYLSSFETTRIDRDVYFAMYRPVIQGCVDRDVVDICVDTELPDTRIIGFRCRNVAKDVLHYVHVRDGSGSRNSMRGLGVARWMLSDIHDSEGVYTFAPRIPAGALLGPKWRYEPWRRLASKENADG